MLQVLNSLILVKINSYMFHNLSLLSVKMVSDSILEYLIFRGMPQTAIEMYIYMSAVCLAYWFAPQILPTPLHWAWWDQPI